MSRTRREFAQITLAGAPAVGALLRGDVAAAADRGPADVGWAGVQVGLNVPYSFGTGNNMAAEESLERALEVGVGALELRAQPVEHFLGSPTVRAAETRRRRGRRNPPRGRPAAAPTRNRRPTSEVAPGRPVQQVEELRNILREGRRGGRHPQGRRHCTRPPTRKWTTSSRWRAPRRGAIPELPEKRRRDQAPRRLRRQAQALHGLPPSRAAGAGQLRGGLRRGQVSSCSVQPIT